MSQAVPSIAPIPTNTAFQTVLPIKVSSKKEGRPILANPAGMEMMLRSSGTQRQRSTARP